MKKLIALAAVAAFALVVRAVPAAAEHAAVGSAKCKMCHKVEFDSWAKTKHATDGARRRSARPATATAATTGR